jgi:hypothetical protein
MRGAGANLGVASGARRIDESAAVAWLLLIKASLKVAVRNISANLEEVIPLVDALLSEYQHCHALVPAPSAQQTPGPSIEQWLSNQADDCESVMIKQRRASATHSKNLVALLLVLDKDGLSLGVVGTVEACL